MDHPFGKFTILWIVSLLLGIGWSIGSFFTYVLSLFFREVGIPPSLQFLVGSLFVSEQDDLAGLLCYTLTFSVFLILAIHLGKQHKHTLHLPLPKLRPTIIAFFKSTLFLSPIWAWAVWFFEEFRFFLPGDGNWAAIAGLTAIASLHSFLFQSLMPRSTNLSNQSPR